MKDLKRFLSYMGKYRFAYWFILITTLIMESSLQILYSYVTKKTLNAVVSYSSGCMRSHCNIKVFISLSSVFSNQIGS